MGSEAQAKQQLNTLVASHLSPRRPRARRASMNVGESNVGTANPWLGFSIESESGAELLLEQRLQKNSSGDYTFDAPGSEAAVLCIAAGQQTARFAYDFSVTPATE